MTRFKNKVILITGGKTGIGLAIANRLRAEGGIVITAQRRNYDDDPNAWQADLATAMGCKTIIDKISHDFGQLDLLINNAGVMKEAPIAEMDEALWQETIALNLTAPFLLIKHAYQMLKESRGNIINIGSIEGLGANPEHSAYCASKAGLHGLTRSVAIDAGKDGIRCNAIAPGWIDTELNEDFINAQIDPAQFRASIGQIHPLGHTGTPEDIASLAAFLGSDEARFITGEIYRIDGGRMAKLSLP